MRAYGLGVFLFGFLTIALKPDLARGESAASGIRLPSVVHSSLSSTIDGLSPSAIKTAYSMSTSLDGSGQTIALVALDSFTASDINAYQSAFGLPNVTIDTVLIDGATGIPGNNADEVTMSIELMMALAPGLSKIAVYEGPNSSAGILATYNQIASDNAASIVATSWGSTESATPGSLISAEPLVFKQMVAQGQVIYAASGNNGAYADGTKLSVLDPASQPLAMAVGGTALTTASNGSYLSETTWYNLTSNTGSGGGISSIWNATPWQQQAIYNQPGISYTMRSLPDVTLHADPNAGYAIYFNGAWQIYGGTTASTALWAAFNALANQGAINSGGRALGFLAPFLYQAGRDANYTLYLNDIADNNTNGYSLYQAVNGYDIPTGLGSFSIDNLIEYLSTNTAPPNTCAISNPVVIIVPNLQVGDPGDELPYMVYVQNQDNPECGSSTYNLSVSAASGFTTSISQSSVTLQPGESSTFTVSLTPPIDANAGDYAFTVTAANASNNTLSTTASGVFQVLTDRGNSPNLMIEAINGTTFSQSVGGWALFLVIMSADGDGVNGQVVNIIVSGPDSWSSEATTQGDGSFQYLISINSALEIGNYTLSASTEYQGSTVTSQMDFAVTE